MFKLGDQVRRFEGDEFIDVGEVVFVMPKKIYAQFKHAPSFKHHFVDALEIKLTKHGNIDTRCKARGYRFEPVMAVNGTLSRDNESISHD